MPKKRRPEKRVRVFNFTVTRVFKYSVRVHGVEAMSVHEAIQKAKTHPEDGILIPRSIVDKTIVKRSKVRYLDPYESEQKELEINTSEYPRPVYKLGARVLLVLALGLLVGCGTTYQKPQPATITGLYEFDGVKVVITPYGSSNTVSELVRFQNKNVVITVQERY